MRTSTCSGAVPPTRSNCFSSSARRILACSASGRSPISSRNSVPRCASSNLPGLRCDGAGERALLVAEQLGLEQVLGDRRAVDRDERPVGARAERVQRAREQLLAGAALAFEQHRRVGRRRAVQRQRHLLQRRHRRRRSAARRGAARAPPSAACSRSRSRRCVERALDHQQQMIGIDRLGEEVERAFLHRRDRVLDAAERGHDDHRQLRDRCSFAARSTPKPSPSGSRRSDSTTAGLLATSAASASG